MGQINSTRGLHGRGVKDQRYRKDGVLTEEETLTKDVQV